MKNSRHEALEAGEPTYFTGKPCKHGHIKPRWTQSGGCVMCDAIRRKAELNSYKINRLRKLKEERSHEQV